MVRDAESHKGSDFFGGGSTHAMQEVFVPQGFCKPLPDMQASEGFSIPYAQVRPIFLVGYKLAGSENVRIQLARRCVFYLDVVRRRESVAGEEKKRQKECVQKFHESMAVKKETITVVRDHVYANWIAGISISDMQQLQPGMFAGNM